MIETRHHRSAFTLIELLVVIAIIAVLATLAFAIYPRVSPSQKTAQGASQLQGWLLIAKQRAYRDRVPRGVQLIRDSDPRYIRSLAYAEQPDDFSAGTVLDNSMLKSDGSPNDVVNFLLGGGDFRVSCSVGDYLLLGYDLNRTNLYQIRGILPPTGTPPQSPLQISPPLRANVTNGAPYRIIRAPRAIDGEPVLQLPTDIVIDSNPFGDPMPNLVPSNDMIIFSPSGGCTQNGWTPGKFILYVRDVTMSNVLEGDPTLITVYTRTGAIAAHPVNPDPTRPWLFTQDGRSSGM